MRCPVLKFKWTSIVQILLTVAVVLLVAMAAATFRRQNIIKADVSSSSSVLPISDVTKDVQQYSRRISVVQQAPKTLTLSPVCWNESCKADYVRYFHSKGIQPIPAIRHVIWKDESVPEYMVEQLRSWVKIHPNWTYVLWRDQELEVFVATYFPGLTKKFKSLPEQIMRVDAIRYMLLFKYGGVYADLDYTLVKGLDEFRRFHAVVTREPEAHTIHFIGMSWPVKPLANSAFMMSAPGHMLNHFVIQHLESRLPISPLHYAGPIALTQMLEKYQSHFGVANNAMETVYMPPSFSFYPYGNNRLDTSTNSYASVRITSIRNACRNLMSKSDPDLQRLRDVVSLVEYCKDVVNMDAITDKSQPVYAIHDLQKSQSWYNRAGEKRHSSRDQDMRLIVKGLKLGSDFMFTD